MKRKLTLLFTVLFTLFTLPVSGLTAFAAEKSYDNIKDGEYKIKVYAKQDGKSEASVAADYMSDDATLTVKNGETKLTLFIPDNPAMNFNKLEVAGVEPAITPGKLDTEEGNFYTYNVSMLQSILKAVTSYEVPMINLVHENVKLDFHLDGLDELPVKEKEPVVEIETVTETESIPFETVEEEDSSLEKDEEKVKQKGVNGTKEVTYEVTYSDGEETKRDVIKEDITKEAVNEIILVGTKDSAPENEEAIIENPDTTEEVEYKSDLDLSQYFQNPAKFIEKDGNKYIQMTGNMGQFIDTLTIDGKEAVLGEIKEDGTYVMQFEVLKPLSEKLDFNMLIDIGSRVMEHDAKLWFEGEEEPEPNVEVKSETKTEKVKFETVEKKDASLEAGKTKVKQEGVNGTKEVTYEVTYTDGKETERKVKSESITKEPVNKIILIGTKGLKDDLLTPDKVSKIDYTIKQEDGITDSVSNNFFTNKGFILEKDGKKYVQLTITDGKMVKSLKNKYDDAILVKENKDGSIVLQLRVDNDLSNMLLDMHIVVPEGAMPNFPGYDMEHTAIIVFDASTEEEIEVGDHQISALAGNENGPQVSKDESTGKEIVEKEKKPENGNGDKNGDTPKKPTFGSNDGDGQKVAASSNDDKKNPQTGDTSAIMFYALLLIGSLIPLAVKFKRRFV